MWFLFKNSFELFFLCENVYLCIFCVVENKEDVELLLVFMENSIFYDNNIYM